MVTLKCYVAPIHQKPSQNRAEDMQPDMMRSASSERLHRLEVPLAMLLCLCPATAFHSFDKEHYNFLACAIY